MTYEEFSLDKDPRDFLSMTGIQMVDKGSYMSLFCPYHNNTKTPSASILLENGIFKCFSCGETRSFFSFLKDQGVAVDLKSETDVSDIHLLRQVRARNNSRAKSKEITTKKVEYISLDSELVDKYLGRRGASDITKNFLGIVYDSKSNRILIPIYDRQNNILSYERRAIRRSEVKVLYDIGANVNVSIFLHEHLDSSKCLHLVEGMMDLIPCIETGELNVSHTFGSLISKDQISNLNEFPSLILYLDGDKAGIKWCKFLIENYSGTIEKIHYIEKEDPNSIWVQGLWDTYLDSYYSIDDFLYQIGSKVEEDDD